MADRPILFSATMIRALLAGTKTQTRRLLSPRNTLFDGGRWPNYLAEHAFHLDRAWIDLGPSPAGNPGPYLKLPVTNIAMQPESREETVHRVYPVTQPGDRLWVREGWYTVPAYDDLSPSQLSGEESVRFDADSAWQTWGHSEPRQHGRLRSPIHMPRWASRLTLTVTEVRVQRLQDISEADAVAEGIELYYLAGLSGWTDYGSSDGMVKRYFADPRKSYASLWESLHGSGSWEANPWVVAVSFDA